jgi:hypothetical protein
VLQEYFIEPAATIEFNIADVDDLRRFTWMPVNRNCQIRLKTVNIEAESGDHVPYNMSGNYDGFSNGVITFSARYPRLDFDISDNMRVRRFTACFEVVFEEEDILVREKDCQIEAILNSWSWRITAPLRILCSYIQAISNKIRAL